LRIALVVEGAATPEAAEGYRQAYARAFGLPATAFAAALPGTWESDQIHQTLTTAVPGSTLASLVGPTAWLDAIGESDDLVSGGGHFSGVAQVAFDAPSQDGKVGAGGNALLAAVEVGSRVAATAAGDQRQPAAVPGRREVFAELGLPPQHDVLEGTREAVAARQQRIRTLHETARVGK
jgi:hypothetical protein